MVLFDTDYLSFLFYEDAGVVEDPRSHVRVERVPHRISQFVLDLERQRAKILVPPPVLTEILCRDPARMGAVLEILSRSSRFEIAAFDTLAAVETAAGIGEALRTKRKKLGASKVWAEIKFDRQIVAIAKVRQVSAVYSHDAHVRTLAKHCGLNVIPVWELPEPPPEQTLLTFDVESGDP